MPAWVCGIVMRWSYFSMPIETDFRGREACRRNAANYARTTKMRKGFVNEILVYFQELYAKICLQKRKQLRQLF